MEVHLNLMTNHTTGNQAHASLHGNQLFLSDKDMRDVKMWKGGAGGKNKIADDVGAGMGKCLIGL